MRWVAWCGLTSRASPSPLKSIDLSGTRHRRLWPAVLLSKLYGSRFFAIRYATIYPAGFSLGHQRSHPSSSLVLESSLQGLRSGAQPASSMISSCRYRAGTSSRICLPDADPPSSSPFLCYHRSWADLLLPSSPQGARISRRPCVRVRAGGRSFLPISSRAKNLVHLAHIQNPFPEVWCKCHVVDERCVNVQDRPLPSF